MKGKNCHNAVRDSCVKTRLYLTEHYSCKANIDNVLSAEAFSFECFIDCE